VELHHVEVGALRLIAVLKEAGEGGSTLVTNAMPDLDFFLRCRLPACRAPLDGCASQCTQQRACDAQSSSPNIPLIHALHHAAPQRISGGRAAK
jgi:hypothetical protein